MIAQIQLQGAPEQLKQHLKADLGNSWIIPTLAELITDKGIWISILVSILMLEGERCVQLTLCPSDFIETEQDALIMEGLANEIASLRRDVVIVFAEDLEILAIDTYETQRKYIHTISISPLISPALSKLSSFLPRARVLLWISVAK